MYFGSARIEHNKVLPASVALPWIDFATSLWASVTIFLYIGHIGYIKEIEITDIVESGPALIFVAFPSMLGLISNGNFFCAVFFLLCINFGIATVFGVFAFYMQMIKDAFPKLNEKMRPELQVIIITLGSLIFSMMFVVEAGFMNFQFFDKHSGNI